MRRGRPHQYGLLISLLAGCEEPVRGPRVEPTFVRVALGEGFDPGEADDVLPFRAEPFEVPIRVDTLDVDGRPYPYNGELLVRVRPGRLAQSPFITVVDGVYEGVVQVEAAFGPARIWVSDERTVDEETGAKPSYATGVTDPIHISLPTIGEMQRSDDPETNQIAGEYGEMRVEDRRVVVVATGTNGFWVTDLDDGADGFGSLFIYTFNKPPFDVVPGARLKLLQGGVQEYLATTQFSFPKLEVFPGESLPVPEPPVVDPSAVCTGGEVDPVRMEAYESSFVVANDLSVPAGFGPGDPDYEDFLQYGQWPVDIGGCRFYAETSALDGVDPGSLAGLTLPRLRGLVVQVYGKWILQVRAAEDLSLPPAAARLVRSRRGPGQVRPRHPDGRPSVASPAPHPHQD